MCEIAYKIIVTLKKTYRKARKQKDLREQLGNGGFEIKTITSSIALNHPIREADISTI